MSDSLDTILARITSLLPQQGPITAFAFLNPLEGMEDQPFVTALRKVPELYGCEPLLAETEYRRMLSTGRITASELEAVLSEEPDAGNGHLVGGLITRHMLRLSMLLHAVHPGNDRELQWLIAETESLSHLHSETPIESREQLLRETREALLEQFASSNEATTPPVIPAQAGIQSRANATPVIPAHAGIQSGVNGPVIPESVIAPWRRRPVTEWNEDIWEQVCVRSVWELARSRHSDVGISGRVDAGSEQARRLHSMRLRDLLVEAGHSDPDALVNEALISFCSAFLDQGYAHWRLPNRDAGFLTAFCQLHQSGSVGQRQWLKALNAELSELVESSQSATDSIQRSLELMGVDSDNAEAVLRASVLAIRGWASMIWQTEVRPDRVYRYAEPGTFREFLAVRLILDRLAAQHVARESRDLPADLAETRQRLIAELGHRQLNSQRDHRSWQILQLAQLHGWSPLRLGRLTNEQWRELITELDAFDSFERRRVFHFAFERQLRCRALNAIAIRAASPHVKPEQPQLQIMTCIDAREESFRRHLEEVAPDVETFGNAGFFNVPMYYRGAGDANFAALCPIVVFPKNWIVEDVVHSLEDSHRQRAMARKVIGTASHNFNVGTRSSLSGALLTAFLGPLATAPLVGRILFPRWTAQMSRTASRFVSPPTITRLRLERDEGVAASMSDDGIGFTLAEMIAMGERALRDTGLTSGFARMVIILGHGSNCLNNPHESAYHCGACSGSAGGPNARALAAILNDVRVRRQLRQRGIEIPEETYFIGGLHNTATEEITWFDVELLPTSHVKQLRLSRDIFSRVAERNAHERCRRFESARLDLTPAEALRHVQDRAEDLAQTRPEYGNCTNAVCFVGRRSRIRGLYLDRRSFQMSYDATQDDAASSILARILAAVIPVCEGINMLYTLSAIDNSGFGCGTKLPHNITSLLGVMDGAASDLRPGLPWQGVDIHEPVRLLFVIESTPQAMLSIMQSNPTVGRICRNGWAQIAVLDPHSARIQHFVDGEFVDYAPTSTELPVAESSEAWYRNRRDHLPFALIRSETHMSSL